MSKKKGYDVSIGPSRVILKLLGLWPNSRRKKNLFVQGLFLFPVSVMFFFVTIPQTVMVTKVWGDLNAVLGVLTTANIPNGISLFKILCLWYKRDVLGQLVLSVAEDWQSAKSPDENRTMWRNARISRLISITIISLAEGTIIAQFAMVVYVNYSEAKRQSMEGYNASMNFRPLYMSAQFFYDVQSSPLFEITWLFQCSSTLFAASSFSSIDAFFAVLVLHLCGQLKNLRKNLKMLSDKAAMDKNDSFTSILSKIVERHEYLYKFANAIESAFNLMFLVQMIASSVVLCLQGYQLVLIITAGDGIPLLELIFMIYFTLCYMFSLFVYCYVAEVLQMESTELGNAAYTSNWYNLRPSETRLLVLIMVRAEQPFIITAGKFAEFSLRLYCSILRSSGGYLSMLLAMKDRLAA